MTSSRIATYALDLARRTAAGDKLQEADYRPLVALPKERVYDLFDGVHLLPRAGAAQGIHLCTICNAKSGRCTEDCRFCSQARSSTAKIVEHPLLEQQRLRRFLSESSQPPFDRCSLVTAGRRASANEVRAIADALASVPGRSQHFCASLGLLADTDLQLLRKAGLTRYHCNLETARSHFRNIVTTHTYDEKLATIASARKQGLSVCVGAIFGVGETDEQVLELALDLKRIQPEAIPVNFFLPIQGTALEKSDGLTPLRCLKILAILRFLLPQQDILVCGGRAKHLAELHSLLFTAGASGVLTGDYLTTKGTSVTDDLRLLADLRLSPRTRLSNPSDTLGRRHSPEEGRGA